MRFVWTFLANDMRSIRRDPLLIYMILVPWLMLLLVRSVVPGLTARLAVGFEFDLVPYYPLILSFFFLLQIPLIFGVIMGLLLLDERDDNTLTALQVTPVSLTTYAAYRAIIIVGLSIVHIVICSPLSGLASLSVLPALAPISILSGLFAPLVALLLAAFAANKVEGLALMKGLTILMVGPLLAYFIGSQWQLLLGILPSYWPAKAFWVAQQNGSIWRYVGIGMAYYAVLLMWFLRRFQARMHR